MRKNIQLTKNYLLFQLHIVIFFIVVILILHLYFRYAMDKNLLFLYIIENISIINSIKRCLLNWMRYL